MTLYPVWFERPVRPELEDLIPDSFERLGVGAPDSDPSASRARGVVASVLPWGGDEMDQMPKLEVIARTGIGVDTVDIDAATERGISVCNTPDGPTVSTAEHTMALMLSAAKGVQVSTKRLTAGESGLYERQEAIELEGKTLGLVGYGRIARRVALVGKALGMNVVAYDPWVTEAGVDLMASLEDLAGVSDVVSVHIPLNTDTEHLFDAAMFNKMKRGTLFVNTARGRLVNQDDLVEALDSGQIWRAALDVTDLEPLPVSHELLNRDDVVVTPHVAGGALDSKRRIFAMCLTEVEAVLDGAGARNVVNRKELAARGSVK